VLHGTQKIGKYWSNIHSHEERQNCPTCDTTENMEHILTHCLTPLANSIWLLAQQLWPHPPYLWPMPSLSIILGCGTLHLPPEQQPEENQPQHTLARTHNRGTKRLLQILISESAHLIWVLRCERMIQSKSHSTLEIQNCWLQVINEHLSEDKITATHIKCNKQYTALITSTWEPILFQNSNLPIPSNWLNNSEVLVGRRHLCPLPI
jgi:hypothetical protein